MRGDRFEARTICRRGVPAGHYARVLPFVFALLTWALTAQAQTAAQEPSAPASDDSAGQARQLFERGVAALAGQRWLEAEALFRRSVELIPRSSSLYNLALSLFEQARYRECVAVIDRTLANADERDLARSRTPALRLRERALLAVARYTLTLEPADAVVRIDGGEPLAGGAERELLLDPGAHRVAISAPGYQAQELALELKGAELASGRVALARDQ